MKYLSVCSGIEAASVAWHPLGWKPLAFSEIEPFPRAVLQHHYPDVPLHGDFTVLRDQPWIADADILVGGTPCQAFSVAGLRNSLADERGNLSLEFVRLADAIDDLRLSAGRDPGIVVWENVPGVLSVKDNAFGCFLAGLAGDVAPYVPPRGKWTNAGVVAGPQRAVAWRVLDAQYFGLAQRRRRVFVVASARDGFDPAAVLLEFEGMRRNTPPRREKGQGVAGTIEASLGRSRRAGTPPGALSYWDGVEHPHPTLNQSAKGSGGVGASNQELFSQRGAYLVGDVTAARMVAFGEYSDDGTASTLKSRDYKDATDLVTQAYPDPAYALSAGAQGKGGVFGSGRDGQDTFVTHSLRGEGFDAGEDGTGRGTPLVPVAFSYKDSGNDATVDCSPTLRSLGAYDANGGGQMGVAYAFQPPIAWDEELNASVDISGTVVRGGDGGRHAGVAIPQSGETGKGDAAPCVAVTFSVCPDHCGGDKSGQEVAFVKEIDVSRTLDCTGADVSRKQGGVGVAQHMAVRRLTPGECERLQGFPNNYTLIPWKKKPASECPDGPRYKALGNSMAVPCMAWIGRRISEQVK